MLRALLCLLAFAADAASVGLTVTSIAGDVDMTTTCAEAAKRDILCTGDNILKERADELPCTFPCTDGTCCHPRVSLNHCLSHWQCKLNGDFRATCVNSTCLCSANYVPDSRNVNWAGCVLNRVWFTLVFAHGNFDLLTEAHRAAITNALGSHLKKVLWITFSRGSIVVSGEAETTFGSVVFADLDDDLRGAAPESVLGATMKTAYDVSDPRLRDVGSLCLSTDPGAFEARKINVSGTVYCLPTRCKGTVDKQYEPVPVDHKCVPYSNLGDDDGLSTAAKVGIALGAVAGAALCAVIVIIVVVVVMKKDRKSEAPPKVERPCAPNEPAAEPEVAASEAARSCGSNEPAWEPQAVVVDTKEARRDALEAAVSDAAEKLAAARTEVAAARLALRNDGAAADSEALALEAKVAEKDDRISELERELARLRSGADATGVA
eukprot:Rhum_TRINITY_DN15089_c4_g1::Rhum_TRINITY_DN15089_c4_g1_i5::g.136634::m.136634